MYHVNHINLNYVYLEMAEKQGQNLTKVPFKDTFWKGTTRTRPRKQKNVENMYLGFTVCPSSQSKISKSLHCLLMYCVLFCFVLKAMVH